MLKPVKGGFVGDYEYENEGTGKEQDTSGMARIRLGSGEKEEGYKIPKSKNIKDYLGDGVYIEYFKEEDLVMLSVERNHGQDKHYIYLDQSSYEALRNFAKKIGWETFIMSCLKGDK